jgi:hypothetical protein
MLSQSGTILAVKVLPEVVPRAFNAYYRRPEVVALRLLAVGLPHIIKDAG